MVEEKKVEDAGFEPRDGWQSELVSYLQEAPSNRTIVWYYDGIGNIGKSFFATSYRDRSVYLVTGGKNADIYYAYNYEEVVFFDLPRSRSESCPYDVMEAFKNGYFLSTKYECRPVRFKTPHVVVFANFMPDTSQLSFDRWDIREIKS